MLLQDMWRDLRHAVRVLSRTPGFAAGALLTLALGIGATAAVFSIVRTVMLEPLPYDQPDRIVTIWETNRGGATRNVIAPANFAEWRERSRTLDHFGIVEYTGLTVMLDGHPLVSNGLSVSADAFHAMGVQPALGRAYTAEEDFGGANAVIVISHDFWQRRLGARSDVLGLTLTTDRGPRTVIGVMPPAFTIVGQKFDFLAPFGLSVEQLRASGIRNFGSILGVRWRLTGRTRLEPPTGRSAGRRTVDRSSLPCDRPPANKRPGKRRPAQLPAFRGYSPGGWRRAALCYHWRLWRMCGRW
jgi:hypothetical protein